MRSLLEKGLRHVGPEDGELQFIVLAPAHVRTSQLKLQPALGVRNNRHKARRNSFWFTHRPQGCAATSLVRIGIHRYVPRYRDGRHKSQGILVRATRDHCRRALSLAPIVCDPKRHPWALPAGITPQQSHGVDLNSGDGSICLALRPGEVFRHFSRSRRGICRATPSCIRRRSSPAGRCQSSSDHQGG